MSEVRGSVLAVNGKNVNGKTIYEVAFSDGQTYATFKNEVADAAKRLQGQPAVAQVTSKQKGQYTNYYLDSIEPGAGAVEAAPSPIPVATTGGRSPEVEQRIVRQNVIGTAFNFVGHILSGSGDIEGAKKEALALARELYSHAFHGHAPKPPDTHEPAPETITAQVAEVTGAGAGTPDW